MLKRMFLFLALIVLVFCPLSFADMSDHATLGGQDSSGNYDVRVDSSGNVIAYNNLTFNSTLRATGVANGGVADAVTTDTTIAASYSLIRAYVTTRTLTLGNGKAGQVITVIGCPGTDTGTLTLTATTKYGWSTITIDAVLDLATLLYIDDTYGWVLVGANNITVA